jgi:replicative DNA helicase
VAKKKLIVGDELTFYDIAYSLAGAKNVDHVLKMILQFEEELLSLKEVEVRKCMVDVYEETGMFPSWTFMQDRFGVVSNSPIRNMGDLQSALKELQDCRLSDRLRTEISNASATAESADELVQKLEEAAKRNKKNAIHKLQKLGSIRAEYDFLKNAPFGITFGFEVIDELTAGGQQGTVSSIAGFTSHGKSTVSNNMAYRNAKLGKKVMVVSLEITKQLTHKIFLSRHSYEMNKPIPYQTILRGHLPKEDEDLLFDVVEADFIENIAPNLLIVDAEDIPSYSERGFEQLYALAEETLGGLDLVIWDHVNQFLYVNPGSVETGNHYIKYLSDLTKKYMTKQGTLPHTTLVVQTNRDGWRSAMKRDGKYDLTALQDFNEIEKSCTYVIFIYADEAMRDAKEAKMQLVKHRLGQTMLEPEALYVEFAYSSVGREFKNIVASFNPNMEASVLESFLGGTVDSKSDYSFDDTRLEDALNKVSSKIVDAKQENGIGVVDALSDSDFDVDTTYTKQYSDFDTNEDFKL